MTAAHVAWTCLLSSVVVVGAYELRLLRATRRNPTATARSVHRALRGEWVRALSARPGTEIVAVQALRNSLMSATISASTAAVLLMGAINLLVSNRTPGDLDASSSFRLGLEGLLVLTLLATHVCAAMAVRYYHHTGFVLSLPVGSAERVQREGLAVLYVQRAGILYSWSLRLLLYASPIALGLLSAIVMVVAAVCLVAVLISFDRVPTLDP